MDTRPRFVRANPRRLMQRARWPRCVALIGIQASGKSTLAVQLEQLGYERLNGDLIRKELYGDESIVGDHEDVFAILEARLDDALASGKQVVLDLTNVTVKGRQPLVSIARRHRLRPHFVLIDTPLAVCLQRNRERERHVPEAVVVSTARSLKNAGLPSGREGSLAIVRQTADREVYEIVPHGVRPHVFTLPNNGRRRRGRRFPPVNSNSTLSPSGPTMSERS